MDWISAIKEGIKMDWISAIKNVFTIIASCIAIIASCIAIYQFRAGRKVKKDLIEQKNLMIGLQESFIQHHPALSNCLKIINDMEDTVHHIYRYEKNGVIEGIDVSVTYILARA